MTRFFFLFAMLVGGAAAAHDGSAELFQKSELLNLDLAYDISLLQASKESLREQGLPGVLAWGKKQLHVKILSRGKGSFRCDQPQLKIDFNDPTAIDTPFEGLKKVKLFTRGSMCLPNLTDETADKAILANYLNYRLYELTTPYHFKTRLVQISYTDTSGKIPPYRQLAFFLESSRNLEKRLDLTSFKGPYTDAAIEQIKAKVDPDLITKIDGFQLLIANMDYGVPGFYSPIHSKTLDDRPAVEKNVQLYQSKSGTIYPFIYDFDFSRLNFSVEGTCWACLTWKAFHNPMGIDLKGECSEEGILQAINTDLEFFPRKKEVINQAPELGRAMHQWIQLYGPQLETLGQKYISDMEKLWTAHARAYKTN